MPSEVEKKLQAFIDQAQGPNFDLAGCQKHLEECRRRLGIGPFSAGENVSYPVSPELLEYPFGLGDQLDELILTVNQNVALLKMRQQVGNHLVHHSGRHHQPNGSRLFELRREVLER